MKNRAMKLMVAIGWAALALLLCTPMAPAQTAIPSPLDANTHMSWLGQYTNSGCPTSVTWCFVPWASTNPLPVADTPSSSVSVAVSHASTTALGNSLVVKASPGNLYAFNCTGIAGAAAGYCIVYNGTVAPGTGALTGANVLDACFFDTTAKGCTLSRIPMGANYSAGIVILLSSAASPYTYTTGTDTGMITADYQ